MFFPAGILIGGSKQLDGQVLDFLIGMMRKVLRARWFTLFQQVLVADEKYDITEKVLKALNEGDAPSTSTDTTAKK